MYPIYILKTSGKHKSIDKSYAITAIQGPSGSPSNAALVIYRWGKTTSMSHCKIETFSDPNDLTAAIEQKVRDKRRNGYDIELKFSDVKEVQNLAEFRKALGIKDMGALSREQLEFILPDENWAGVRKSSGESEFDEDWSQREKSKAAAEKAAEFERLAREAKQREIDEEQQALENLPHFGEF